MQEHVAASMRQVNELSAPGNTPSLSEVRDKIEARYANALGQAELAQSSVEGRMLEVEKATLDVAGASRLDQIRAAHGGGARPAVEGSPAAGRDRRRAAGRRRCRPARGRSRGGRAGGAPGAVGPERPDAQGQRSAAAGARVVGLAGAGLRVDRGAGGLAGRAPPGDPLLQWRPLLAEQDRRAAAEAGLAAAAEDPVVAAAARVAGGVLLGVVQVGAHQRPGALDEARRGRGRRRPGSRGARRRGTATRPCRGCRCRPGCAGRRRATPICSSGCVAQPAQRLVEVPVGAEHVGAEMADEPVLLGGGDERRCRAAGSRRTPSRRWRGPRGRRRPARPATSSPGR